MKIEECYTSSNIVIKFKPVKSMITLFIKEQAGVIWILSVLESQYDVRNMSIGGNFEFFISSALNARILKSYQMCTTN